MSTYKIYGPRTVRHEIGELDMVGEFYAVSSEGHEEEVPEWAFCWDLPSAKAALADLSTRALHSSKRQSRF